MTLTRNIFLGGSFFCGLMLYSAVIFADVSGDLDQYFKGMGFSSNVTSPQAYHGQQAGYYTGGSLFARTPVRDVQLMEVELPGYRAGCGGIDLFTGGFSYVKYDEMVKLMRNILNNSAGYAFTLAMETATPELANVMKFIQDQAAKINRANINSCETAEALVGGAWSRTRATQQQICRDIGGNQNGLFDDWAQARQQCGTGNQFDSTMDKARQDPRYKHSVFDSGNVVWKVLKQQNLFSNDDALAEFFMSLSGSFIISKKTEGDASSVDYQPLRSLMDKDGNNLIHGLLAGGEVRVYRCDSPDGNKPDENGCLHPREVTITLAADTAFGSRVRRLLDDIVNKILTDEALTKEEIGLLQSTSLPIYKILNVQAAYANDKDTLDVAGYADIIATDIIFQYLEENLRVVKAAVAASHYPEDFLKELQHHMEEELTALRQEQKNAYSQLSLSIQLIEKTQVIEKMLAGELSSELGNALSWAKGLK
jgi:conjugative transfer pilus assembly protein TraH